MLDVDDSACELIEEDEDGIGVGVAGVACGKFDESFLEREESN